MAIGRTGLFCGSGPEKIYPKDEEDFAPWEKEKGNYRMSIVKGSRSCIESLPIRILLSLVPAMGLGFFLAGCAADSQAGKQAGRGAALGAVGGAVGGAVSSLLWGGNIVEGTVKGGVAGAATGAAVGAVSGAMADSEAKQMEARTEPEPKKVDSDPRLAQLEKKMGKKNFEAATLLAECKHGQAIGTAVEAYAGTQDPKQRAYSLLIQAVAAEEMGDKDMAASLYPRIVQATPSIGTAEKARTEALEGVMKIQRIRKDYGLPPLCSNLK